MTNSPSQAVGVRSPAPRQAVLDRIDEFQAAIERDLDALSASWSDQARSASIEPTPWLLAGVVLAGTLAAVLFSFAR